MRSMLWVCTAAWRPAAAHLAKRSRSSSNCPIASAKAAALRREGVDVIPLSAGEPDFDTPRNIKDAGIRAIEEGFTKYTSPPSGIPELKEAVIERFRLDHRLDYGMDEVVVNNGAKHCLALASAAVLNPGDELIIPTPYWVTFTEQPKLVDVELEDTIKSFDALVKGEYDHMPEAAFYMVGGIEEAIEKAKKLEAEVA